MDHGQYLGTLGEVASPQNENRVRGSGPAPVAKGGAHGQTAAPFQRGRAEIVQDEKRSNWTGIAFGLTLASFAAWQQFKLPPVLPLLLDRFGYDRVLAGAFMSVYAVAGLLATLPVARWIARSGAYPALWTALVLFLLGNLVTWAAPEVGWLVLIARGAEGVAFAVCAVVGPATANMSASHRHLPLVIGLTAAWVPIGQVVASLVAQPALTSERWAIAWWAAMAGTLLLTLWTWRIQKRRAIAFAGAAAASTAGGTLTPHERRSLLIAGFAFLLFSGQYYAYMTWLPQYLVEAFGFGPDEALAGYLVPVVVLALWNVIGGWLLRHGLAAGPMLALGMLLQGACWFLLPWTDAGWRGLASLLVYGVGAGLAPTALFAMPSRVVGPGRPLVQAFSIVMMARNVGVLLGPVVLAQLSKLDGGWQLSAPIFGSISAASALLGLWLTLRLRRR